MVFLLESIMATAVKVGRAQGKYSAFTTRKGAKVYNAAATKAMGSGMGARQQHLRGLGAVRASGNHSVSNS